MQTETMQDEATNNLDFDLSRTEELTYKARERINLLKELELLTSDTFINLVTKQSNLEERLRVEKEKARKVCRPDEQITNNSKWLYHYMEGKAMLKGIVRHIDELGRITLPIEMRRELKLKLKDPVDIYLSDGAISVKSYRL